jgi:hypothetical protein
LTISIILMLVFSLVAIQIQTIRNAEAAPDGESWLAGWSYRKEHQIIGSTAGAQSDYTMQIVVHYGSGTDSGKDVYLNGQCQSDFGDIRFTESDGITKLDYWFEKEKKVHDILYVDNLVKYAGNPILTKGAYAWCNFGIRDLCIMKNATGYVVQEDGKYVVYYNGRTKTPTTKTQIGRATSTDLISWTPYDGNPVHNDTSNYAHIGAGGVVKNGTNDYLMVYATYSEGGIAMATSTDGISWTKVDNSHQNDWIVQVANFTGCTATGVPSLTKIDDKWYLTFEGGASGYSFNIFMAESSDGYNWTASNSGNPIYTGGGVGTWDNHGQANPTLYKIADGKYVMLYNGENGDGLWQGGILYSTSLTSGWTSWSGNPLLTSGISGEWDDTRIEGLSMIMDDANQTTLRIWYFGLPTTDSFADGAVGYATCEGSSDVNATFWVKVPTIPINPDSTKIYIYYGKSDAKTTSSGDNTFLFFEDFSPHTVFSGDYATIATNGFVRTTIGLPEATSDWTSRFRVIHYEGTFNRTYISYGNEHSHPMVTYYDHETGEFATPVQIGTSPVVDDCHVHPTLAVDSSGYLYAFYGSHTSAQKMKRSMNPEDISSWGPEKTPEPSDATYPNVFFINSTLYFFYRSSSNWVYRTSNDGGNSWSAIRTVIDLPTGTPYPVMIIGNESSTPSIHIAFLKYQSGASPEYSNIYYVMSSDGGNTWKKADGTILTLPITTSNADLVWVGGTRGFVNDIQLDEDNTPNILWVGGPTCGNESQEGPGSHYFARWNGASWVVTALPGIRHRRDTGCLRVIDSTHFKVYRPSNKWPTWGGEIEEWSSNDSGEAWINTLNLTENSRERHQIPLTCLDYSTYKATTNKDFQVVWCAGESSLGYVFGWGEQGNFSTTITRDNTIGTNPIGWAINSYCTFKISLDGKVGNDSIYRQTSTLIQGEAYRTISQITTDNDRCFEVWIKILSTPSDTYYYPAFYNSAYDVSYGPSLGFRPDGTISYKDNTLTWRVLQSYSQNTWYHLKFFNIDMTNDQFDININGINKGTNLSFTKPTNKLDRVSATASFTKPNTIAASDNYIIRKYVDPEPTHGSWGIEERPTQILVDPSITTAILNNDYIVYVNVTGVTDLYGWEFQLNYSNTILDLTSVSIVSGGLNEPIQTYYSLTDEANGHLWWAVSTTYPTTTGISYAKHAIFEIHFHTLAAGTADLHLYGTILSDSAGSPITHTVSDGTMDIGELDLTVTNINIHDKGCSIYEDDTQANGITPYYYPVNVTINNAGTEAAGAFHVRLTVFYDVTNESSGEIAVAGLAGGASEVINFTDVFHPLNHGLNIYKLTATVDNRNEVVEDDETNNALDKTDFKVTIIGDINGDQTVNILDAVVIALAWDGDPGKTQWNIKADLNHDNTIDIYDGVRIGAHWGENW